MTLKLIVEEKEFQLNVGNFRKIIMLTGFFYLLRDYGIPISMHEVMDFHHGLEKGMVHDLDELYVFARLSLIKRVEHMDMFHRAFVYYFYDIELPAVSEGDPAILDSPEFRKWLTEAIQSGELPPHAHWKMPAEELMKKFWDTFKEQMEEHNGGSKWIGTGGNSAFGHSGNSERGVRVFGQPGGGSAIKVMGDRNYVNYSADHTLSGANLRQALDSLKHLKHRGPETELNLDETIYRTSKNGGEIELIFERDLRDKIKVVLLIDNGGYSMTPYVDITRLLFSKMNDRFKEITTYYFHNTIYNTVYKNPARTKPHPTAKLLTLPRDTRILIMGDASMAPEELMYSSGMIDMSEPSQPHASIDWLKALKKRFPYMVWLNPIPQHEWDISAWTLEQIREVFHMEELTLRGIKQTVDYLNSRTEVN